MIIIYVWNVTIDVTMHGSTAGLVLIVICTNINFKIQASFFDFYWHHNYVIWHEIVDMIQNTFQI